MTFVHDINDASGNSDNGSSGKDDRKCVLKITKGLISFSHPGIIGQSDPKTVHSVGRPRTAKAVLA